MEREECIKEKSAKRKKKPDKRQEKREEKDHLKEGNKKERGRKEVEEATKQLISSLSGWH